MGLDGIRRSRISLALRTVPFHDAVRELQEQTHIPIECSSDILRNASITLYVKGMKVRHVALWIGEIAGIKPTFLTNRIRFENAVETNPAPEPEQSPLLPQSHF